MSVGCRGNILGAGYKQACKKAHIDAGAACGEGRASRDCAFLGLSVESAECNWPMNLGTRSLCARHWRKRIRTGREEPNSADPCEILTPKPVSDKAYPKLILRLKSERRQSCREAETPF